MNNQSKLKLGLFLILQILISLTGIWDWRFADLITLTPDTLQRFYVSLWDIIKCNSIYFSVWYTELTQPTQHFSVIVNKDFTYEKILEKNFTKLYLEVYHKQHK